MSRCVCGHIRSLHKDGVCQARVHPCGCRQYETPEDAQRPTFLTTEPYQGIYGEGKYR